MSKVEVSNSFPFLSILTLIFITLKLTGYIDWSWFWVLSPLVIPLGLIFSIIFLVILGDIIYKALQTNKKNYDN